MKRTPEEIRKRIYQIGEDIEKLRAIKITDENRHLISKYEVSSEIKRLSAEWKRLASKIDDLIG